MNDFIYGAISGVAQTVIGYPFDSYKVLKQSNMQTTKHTYKTLMSGIKFPLISSTVICGVNFGSYILLRENGYGPCEAGFMSGVIITPIVFMSDTGKISRQLDIKGSWLSLLRERKGGWTATTARESIGYGVYFKSLEECKSRGINPFVSGAIAGLANWTITYPIDSVKSRQLAYKCNIMDAIKKGNIWNGYVTCAVRAVTVNSAGFYVYDKMKEIFDKK
jgi:hypothetical protein